MSSGVVTCSAQVFAKAPLLLRKHVNFRRDVVSQQACEEADEVHNKSRLQIVLPHFMAQNTATRCGEGGVWGVWGGGVVDCADKSINSHTTTA